ncbi:MAG: BamA/TamA family outer membrane protein [Myxococcaceae bacterium]|nr:BamA/TamA family outer membrane protein [Myxococcaceae bacterium]
MHTYGEMGRGRGLIWIAGILAASTAWALPKDAPAKDGEPPRAQIVADASLPVLADHATDAEPAEDDEADDESDDGDDDDPGTGGAGSAAREQAQRSDRRQLDALGVPLISYNSDLGVGFGAVGGGYYYSPGYTPYRHALAAQIFLTTRGIQNHWLRYDGPNLIGKLRVEVRAEYRRELYAPFYGIGNESVALPKLETRGGADQNNSYDYFFPGGWVRVRGRPWKQHPQFEVWGGYGYHWIRIDQYAGSALTLTNPLGVKGGNNGQIFVGALWDTRDNETDPSRGSIQEIALRGAAGPTVSDYTWAGLTLVDRHFFSLGTPKLIFAQRVMFDALKGAAPFFEWSQFGGLTGGEGIGGMSSVRGVLRNRFQGKVKLVSNSELRWYPIEFKLFHETTRVGGLLFFDAGRVWHEGVDDGPFWRWHPGIGAGLRLVRRAAVLRADFGFSTETWDPGIYLTFGHMY